MYKGKATCKILKEIRKQIAKENDIAFVTSECKYQGDCLGTCPACEAEVRYLEEELRKRKQLGKTAVVAGISLGLAATFASCHVAQEPNTEQEVPVSAATEQAGESNVPAESANEEEGTPPAAKTPRPTQRSTQDYMGFDFGGVDEPPVPDTLPQNNPVSDTIEIIYEIPEWSQGDIVPVSWFVGKGQKDVYDPYLMAYPPSYQDGEEALREKIYKNLHLSKKESVKFQRKKIFIQFIVEKDGRVKDVKAHAYIPEADFKPLKNKCEKAAKRALRSRPHYKPGRDDHGMAVRCFQQVILEVP
ncbi:MAG: hypothetical protein MJZ87_04605 [Bacteroidales bacterium]|nr:hypothetical protein [Bacteroidales bacterium]